VEAIPVASKACNVLFCRSSDQQARLFTLYLKLYHECAFGLRVPMILFKLLLTTHFKTILCLHKRQ
jgi:hypothetical protein